MFIPLTAHSAYSLQEGLLLPSELVQVAEAQHLPALGLSDHRLLSGSIEFAVACQRAGIQPVLGLEIELIERSGAENKLSLLAMNINGWSNLCRLSSMLALREDPEAGCKIDQLVKYSDDLIAIVPSPPQTAQDESAALVVLKVIFKDRLYAALDDPRAAVHRSMLAHRLHIPCVVTHPIYYLSPEQESLQRTLSAIRLNVPVSKLPPDAAAPKGAHLPSQEEIQARFLNFPSAIEATQEIAARCKFDLPLVSRTCRLCPCLPV
jgi:DNA polymerase III alpha subunit